MNIIELAKEVGITSPDGFKLTVNPVQLEKLQDLVNAVIKARDAELIEGVSEPAHHIMSDGQCIGYYSAEQVAAAVAKKDAEIEQLRAQLAGCGVAAMQNTEKSRSQRAVKGDYGYSESYADVCRAVDREIEHRERISTLESTLKVALEALNTVEWYGPGSCWVVDADAIEEAIEKCKEVLHD